MAQVFISAAHGGLDNSDLGVRVALPNTTEAAEIIQIRDLVVAELRSRSLSVLTVPDDLDADQCQNWINARCGQEDVALEIRSAPLFETSVRGAAVYYIGKNEARCSQAELLLLALLRRAPQLPSRGVRPDTEAPMGSLAFCRMIHCPALQMQVGHLSNPEDLALLQNQRRDIALGIADGVAAWSRAVNTALERDTEGGQPMAIGINVNGGLYDEAGLLISDNAYIPVDLVEQFDLDLDAAIHLRRVRQGNVVYVKAIDLRQYNISVKWEAETQTIQLRSRLGLETDPALVDRIMGQGITSEVQLIMFLKGMNEKAISQYPDLAKIYREEAMTEGINHDLAFCQMLVETNALAFNIGPDASDNNFGGIGSPKGVGEPTSFSSARLGVRAHIQHLKAYASQEPLVLRPVDPRFFYVRRGVAPRIEQLGGRWSADMDYGQKILALVRRLYESAGLL
jgi:hypothetical protein